MKNCTFTRDTKKGDACEVCGFRLPFGADGRLYHFACGSITNEAVEQYEARMRERGRKPDYTPAGLRAPRLANLLPMADRLEEWGRERLAICRACERHVDDGAERCGVLVAKGRTGLLMHPKGIPNPSARCPLGRWGKAPESRPEADR
jgi:hypothetical protein